MAVTVSAHLSSRERTAKPRKDVRTVSRSAPGTPLILNRYCQHVGELVSKLSLLIQDKAIEGFLVNFLFEGVKPSADGKFAPQRAIISQCTKEPHSESCDEISRPVYRRIFNGVHYAKP